MSRGRFLVAGVLLLACSKSFALTAGELRHQCKALLTASDATVPRVSKSAELVGPAFSCAGYIRGFRDGFGVGVAGAPEKNPLWCLEGRTNEQLVAAFLAETGAHPEVWHQPAPMILSLILADRFRCVRPTNPK